MRRKIAPGDWFWYRQTYYQIGMQLHLATVLPSGILSAFQFVPALRNKYRAVHRISGRVAFTLLYISMIGAVMIAPRSIGGAISVQAIVGTLCVMTGYSVFRSWTSIRHRRIADHRRWALRAMFYMGSIITARVIMISTTLIVTNLGTNHTLFRCDELEFTLKEGNLSDTFSIKYPSCEGVASSSVVGVKANLAGSLEEMGSALRLTFGAALWLALMIHTLGVECYINSTEPKAKGSAADQSSDSELRQGVLVSKLL
ncbi:hypothetical protein FRB96_008426 [Tulasnella sp. 330]|nr:hypothetical protein FRB96_008426 [Tulasnella sp. 330]